MNGLVFYRFFLESRSAIGRFWFSGFPQSAGSSSHGQIGGIETMLGDFDEAFLNHITVMGAGSDEVSE